MMVAKSLYVAGPPGSGKTGVCAALAMKLQEEGLRVAYFKPVGYAPGPERRDEDALLMKELLGMEEPLEEIVPFNYTPLYLSRYAKDGHLETVAAAYRKLARKVDALLVGGGPSPHAMAGLGLDVATIAGELEIPVLLVLRVSNDQSLDLAIFYHHHLRGEGLEVAGVLFNHVPRPLLDKARGVYRPFLETRGVRLLGIIPERLEITAPTVEEFYDVLGGEILAAEDHLGAVVEDVVVGAMTLESALRYFRRAPNKVVITGGDRSDLALAALETSTSALILTGGLYPDVQVLARAEEKEVPVILVGHDTFTTIELLHDITRKIKPTNLQALQLARESLEAHCEVEAILAYLR